jgi:type IV pilus assembly protein PilQ
MDRRQNTFVTLRFGTRLSAMLLASIAGTRAALAQNSPQNQPIEAPPSAGLDPVQTPNDPAFQPGSTDGGVQGVQGTGKTAFTDPAVALAAGKFKDPMNGGKSKKGLDIKVDGNQLVDLAVKDEDLAAVLEMLSLQSQKNIIASKDVSAKVTANFFGVTFYQAMDAILHANGFGYIEKDNFIYVYTAEQLAAIIEAQKVRVSKVINLNYINPIDAAEFVKAALSEGGQIKTPGKTAAFPSAKDVPIGEDQYVGRSILVVTDYEENIAAVEDLIKRLDERPVQVEIQATIVQANLTEANAFGVDFSLLANLDFSSLTGVGGPGKAADALGVNNQDKLSSPGSGDTPLVPNGSYGGAAVSNPGNFAGPGTLKVGFIKNDVALFLRVLDQVTDTTVLSNPRLLVLNRMASRVLVGRRVGYLNTTSTDTATTQTVEFLDTGTQLHVRPFVSDDGVIRMELKPQVSEAIVRDVRNSSGSVVTVPDEITNELNTNVIVRDGQTVVLGGLFRDKTQTTRRQVPFLGDIPILGEAFRGTDNEVERTEIIFLVTPRIVNDQSLAAAGLRGLEKVDQLRAGGRENLLMFSREKRSSQLLVEAQRLADAGDTQKALFKVQQSLVMNPVQTDALALKEKLTGQKTYWPSRSMIDEIVREQHGMPKADATGTPSADPSSLVDVTVSDEPPAAPASENAANAQGVAATGEAVVLAEPVVVPDGHSDGSFPAAASTEPAFDTALNTEPVVELSNEARQSQYRLAVASLFKYLTGVFPLGYSDVGTFAQFPDQESPSK